MNFWWCVYLLLLPVYGYLSSILCQYSNTKWHYPLSVSIYWRKKKSHLLLVIKQIQCALGPGCESASLLRCCKNNVFLKKNVLCFSGISLLPESKDVKESPRRASTVKSGPVPITLSSAPSSIPTTGANTPESTTPTGKNMRRSFWEILVSVPHAC